MGRKKYDIKDVKEECIPDYVKRRLHLLKLKITKNVEKYQEERELILEEFDDTILGKFLIEKEIEVTIMMKNDFFINCHSVTKKLIKEGKECVEEIDFLYKNYAEYLIDKKLVDDNKYYIKMTRYIGKIRNICDKNEIIEIK